MSYSPTILARAEARLKQAQEAHRRQQAQQQAAIHQALPRTAEIDRRLRQTAPGSWRPPSDRAPIRRAPWPPSAGRTWPSRRRSGPSSPRPATPPTPWRTPPLPPVRRPGLEGGGHVLLPGGSLPPGADRRTLLPAGPGGTSRFQTFRLDYYSDQVDPSTAAPPGGHGPLILRVCRQYGEGFPQYPHRNLFLYGAPGAGEDLPLRLHRPDGGGERVLRGLRHRRQRLCPV